MPSPALHLCCHHDPLFGGGGQLACHQGHTGIQVQGVCHGAWGAGAEGYQGGEIENREEQGRRGVTG